MAEPLLFIFGLGYTGQALARRALARGWRVAGTSRSEATRAQLSESGIAAVPYDAAQAALGHADYILSTVAPEGAVDVVLRDHGAHFPPAAWLGYCSTTGVYGDWQGAWVDEQSPPRGATPRLLARLAAEEAWRARGAHIFRLAGIYGPGRNALEEVRAGTARCVDKPGQVFSRIHVEDIAGALCAAMARPGPGALYNLADTLPSAPHEVVAYACALLDAPPPVPVPFAQAELSPMAREFYGANRRVRAERMRQELGYVLRYPTYREGLRALLA